MEKQNAFFDPYNFSTPNMNQNMGPNMMPNMAVMPEMDMMSNSPAMYYEQQYMYYKYMTQMLEYKMKLKEWEMMSGKDKNMK